MKAKQLRSKAWNALKGRYWWAVLAALIASLFGVLSSGTSSSSITKLFDGETESVFSGSLESLSGGAAIAVTIVLLAILLISLAMCVLSGSIRLGYSRFNMDLFTEVEKPSMSILFSRLKKETIWKAFWMVILRSLIIAAGFLLFIVPGVILALAYSQSDFIMAENPDMKVTDVLKKSRSMMKGNKWAFFCLWLSFIGWGILAAIVPAGALLLAPYTELASAAFYLDRTGRLKDKAENLNDLESKA